ncbi:hypothetical protein ACLOJK_003713 [Asimina triloba]
MVEKLNLGEEINAGSRRSREEIIAGREDRRSGVDLIAGRGDCRSGEDFIAGSHRSGEDLVT